MRTQIYLHSLMFSLIPFLFNISLKYLILNTTTRFSLSSVFFSLLPYNIHKSNPTSTFSSLFLRSTQISLSLSRLKHINKLKPTFSLTSPSLLDGRIIMDQICTQSLQSKIQLKK
ncbi:hypothetical protein AMTRI_Chr10g226310 [Amborella trichopoda]